MMMMYFLAFVSSYFFVFLKSWQQSNVTSRLYAYIIPTSMLMAVCEVYVVSQVAKNGWGWICLVIGLGAGLGSMCATWAHYELLGKKGNK